jgi:hypothetical protein
MKDFEDLYEVVNGIREIKDTEAKHFFFRAKKNQIFIELYRKPSLASLEMNHRAIH